MSVSAIGSAYNPYQNGVQNPNQQRRAEFQQLAQSLQAGDLSGARQAFASLQQMFQSAQQGQSGNGVPPTVAAAGSQSGGTSLQNDLAALGKALQSGNLGSAQQSFATFMQDLQSVRQGHHHHHGAGAVQGTAAAASASGSGSDGDNDGSGAGGVHLTA